MTEDEGEIQRELLYLDHLRRARSRGRAITSIDNCSAILLMPGQRAALPPELLEPQAIRNCKTEPVIILGPRLGAYVQSINNGIITYGRVWALVVLFALVAWRWPSLDTWPVPPCCRSRKWPAAVLPSDEHPGDSGV